MKKTIYLFFASIILFASCAKTNTGTPFNAAAQASTDNALIKAYIAKNNITATKDSSGLYYSIITPGTGAYPTANSTVSVTYTGQLLNGSTFAPSDSISSAPLKEFIEGWQIGIPYINTGGKILLLIPSALGYGNTSPGAAIPANSVLVFTIGLKSFTN